jgi:hypothetical protein
MKVSAHVGYTYIKDQSATHIKKVKWERKKSTKNKKKEEEESQPALCCIKTKVPAQT